MTNTRQPVSQLAWSPYNGWLIDYFFHSLLDDDSTPSTITPPVFDDRDMESANEKPPLGRRKRPLKERGCCVRCCCCACLPRWAAYAVWALIIAIIIVVIVLASIFATFKMPTFGFVGLASAPDGGNSNSSASTSSFTLSSSDFSVTNGEFSFRFGLEVNVNNPNVFPLHFSNMNATVSDGNEKRIWRDGRHLRGAWNWSLA